MKNKDFKKIIPAICASTILIAPMVVLGQGSDNLGGAICSKGVNCGFEDLMKLANAIVQFLMFKVAIPLAALGFMYAGARMVIIQNKEKEKTAALEMMENIGKGFAIMLGSFVLIKFILYQFLNTGEGFTLYLLQ